MKKGKPPKEAEDILLALADAAVAWWASKRPLPWSLDAHIAANQINCTGEREKHLARCVSQWCAIQK